MNELTTTEKKEILPQAKNFLEHAQEDLRDIGNRYFMLGCRLWEARRYNYVEALGYESIEQLAEKEFDLGKSSTYNLINVFLRFCDHGEQGQRKAWIDPKYKNYKYSQLIEMEKAMCLAYDIEKEIPPSTPVRIIKEFIKYLNKNPGHHKTLPEWQAEQEQTAMLSPVSDSKQIKGQLTFEQIVPTDKPTKAPPLIPTPSVPVQTFGLPTCAKPAPTVTIPISKKEEVEYNFSTRDGVRNFLKNCCRWKPKEYYSPFIGCYYYTLKNKRRIYVYIQRTANKNDIDGIYEVVHRFFIDLNKYSNVPVEITKEQFEKYCAEHKDEL